MPTTFAQRPMRSASRELLMMVMRIPISAWRVGAQGAPVSSRPNWSRTPTPAHERLAAFEGSWTSADGPSRDRCAWLVGGRRHLICRRVTETASGAQEQMMLYSYRRVDSMYTVSVLLPDGQVWSYAGRPEGNRWVFDLTSDRSETALRLRQVIVAVADTLRFTEEVSENGGPWRLTDPSADYRYVRSPGSPR